MKNKSGKYRAFYMWWAEPESNRRHRDFQSRALPTELSALNIYSEEVICELQLL